MTQLIRKCPKLNVRRSEAVLVPPKEPTPREVKLLADIDNEDSLQIMIPFLMFYRPNPRMAAEDPAKTIKEALAKVLVFFYPLAGRIRVWPELKPKLVVDCTGEGAIFIEAYADATMAELGDLLHPPFPYLDDVLYEVPGMSEIFDCPIVHVQVTQFKCGGFIVGVRFNHVMMDGTGFAQFLTAFGELARGELQPLKQAIWDRDRLFARRPPRETCENPIFKDYAAKCPPIRDRAYRIFYLTSIDIATLRDHIPPYLQKSTSFELLTGFLWRCRTVALQMNPEEHVRLVFAVNTRNKFNPPLQKGFYGNAFAYTGVLTTAGELSKQSFQYAVELVSNAKKNMTEEYMKSLVDGLALRGFPHIPELLSSIFVSDLRSMGYMEVDYGWGRPLSSFPGQVWYEPYPEVETYYFLCNNEKGEYLTVVPICLPIPAMEIFEHEMYDTLKIKGVDPFKREASTNLVNQNYYYHICTYYKF